jgi:2-C-methyl-D-erythritol 2,4-cyclodiphosphate synthase
MKIGIGFDIHRTDKQRKLVLGGIEIESEYGLAGHSDADVLIHAIIDAILGALGKGDIGEHFPDTDEQYKNISSVVLLENVKDMIDNEGMKIGNIDCNIILEKPKLSAYKQQIRDNLAEILNISTEFVNIKAKTNEKLGFIGNGEAVEAQAVVLLETE